MIVDIFLEGVHTSARRGRLQKGRPAECVVS